MLIAQRSSTDPLCNAMNAFVAGGVSVIPIDPSTKRPWAAMLPRDRDTGRPVWEPFQGAIVHPHTLAQWQARGLKSFAVVGGEVSGGLLVIDFDVPRFFDAWELAVGNLAEKLPLQRTGGGGFQVLLRCDSAGANQKLAWLPDVSQKAGRKCAIETRGEGGYAVMAPSAHPSGNVYEWLRGDPENIPNVSQAHADALLDAARRLDECPFTAQQLQQAKAKAENLKRDRTKLNGKASVIDAYNAAVKIEDALSAHGYRRVRERFIRPDANETSDPGVQVFERDGDHLKVSYHWSSNDPLNDGHAHDAFSIFCALSHAGDFSAAVKSAAHELGLEPKKKSAVDRCAEINRSLHAAPVPEQHAPSEELASYMRQIVSGEVYVVPWAYRWLSRLTNALLPGTTTTVCGDPGVGKTFFILQNVLHWHANGFNPAVLFIEKDRRFHTMRFLAQLEGKGCFVDFDWIREHGADVEDALERNRQIIDEVGKNFHSSNGKRITLEYITKWCGQMARDGHRVMIIDPVSAAYAGDRRWEKDDDFVLGCEAEMAAHNSSLVVINHSKKGNRKGPATMHDMGLGAAFQKFCDTLIWIEKSNKPRRVRLMTDHGPLTGKFDLFFQIQKARNGKGSKMELAYTFGEGLMFAEQGVVTKDLPESEAA